MKYGLPGKGFGGERAGRLEGRTRSATLPAGASCREQGAGGSGQAGHAASTRCVRRPGQGRQGPQLGPGDTGTRQLLPQPEPLAHLAQPQWTGRGPEARQGREI